MARSWGACRTMNGRFRQTISHSPGSRCDCPERVGSLDRRANKGELLVGEREVGVALEELEDPGILIGLSSPNDAHSPTGENVKVHRGGISPAVPVGLAQLQRFYHPLNGDRLHFQAQVNITPSR